MHRVRRSSLEAAASTDGTDENLFVIEDSFGYLVNRLARAYAQALADRLARHEISIAQWAVLLFLWAEDGPSQRSLSRSVAIDEATMARTLDRMERDGLVQRRRNRVDRRQQNVYMTGRAAGLRDVLVPHAIEVNALATASLSASDQDQAERLIRTMIASLDPGFDEQERKP